MADETPHPAKSAQDYIDALGTVADIAGFVIGFIPGAPRSAKRVVQAAPHVIRAAQMAAPIIDQNAQAIGGTARKLKQNVQTGAPTAVKSATSLAKKGGAAVAGAAGLAVGIAKGTAGKAFAKASAPLKGSLEAARDRKAQKAARQEIIANAFGRLTIGQFRQNMAKHQQLTGHDDPSYMDQPGCVIFLTLGRGRKDPAAYREVYVEAASSMGKAVKDAMEGKGNVDVYADIKHDQNVHVLFYPCGQDELEPLRDSLIIALDADSSYNKAPET